MNPRIWLFYIFDKNACIAYQTPEACNWQATQLWAYEGDDTSQMDTYLLQRLGDGNVLRALYDPNTGTVAAWAQPTLPRYPQYELMPYRPLYPYYFGQPGITAPAEGADYGLGREKYGF